MKTVRRPPYPNGTQAISPVAPSPPLPLSSRRPSVSFGGFGLRVTLGRTIQLHPSGISVVASPHPAEVHQVFPQNSGVPGSAVAAPPVRRVAPIPVAYLLVSDPTPAESLSRFQAQGQVERLPDRHPAAHAVPVPILVPPGLPEGWLQIPGLPWLARRLGLLWVPVVCGHHSEGGPLRGTTWFWYMSGWSGTSPTASRPKLTCPKGGQ